MKTNILLFISLLYFSNIEAQKKYIDNGFKVLKEATDLQLKAEDANAKKKDISKIVSKYKDAGYYFFKADTGLTPKEKLVAQSYAIICFSKAQDYLIQKQKYKDAIKLAADVVPRLWMRTEKLPTQVNWDSLKPAIVVTATDFTTYRQEYFESLLRAAHYAKNWKAMQQYAPYYLSIAAEPENNRDITNFYKRLNGFYYLSYASGMNKDAPSSRDNAFNFYEYVLKHRAMLEDKSKILKKLVAMDSLFHSSYYNYTDFDDKIKIRAVAAKTFEKLDDPGTAYKLYDEAVNSGSKSISLMMAKLNIAADMQDPQKMEASLKSFEDKKYASELTKEQEKRVREIKSQLKKGD
jgi:hypothetical protein